MKEITALTAHDWLQQDEAILIDVREKDEFDEARIEGALHAPLSILPQAIDNLNIPENKKIIMQCLKGGRSAQAIAFLQENIFQGRDLYNMAGGIIAWHESNFPIIK